MTICGVLVGFGGVVNCRRLDTGVRAQDVYLIDSVFLLFRWWQQKALDILSPEGDV